MALLRFFAHTQEDWNDKRVREPLLHFGLECVVLAEAPVSRLYTMAQFGKGRCSLATEYPTGIRMHLIQVRTVVQPDGVWNRCT